MVQCSRGGVAGQTAKGGWCLSARVFARPYPLTCAVLSGLGVSSPSLCWGVSALANDNNNNNNNNNKNRMQSNTPSLSLWPLLCLRSILGTFLPSFCCSPQFSPNLEFNPHKGQLHISYATSRRGVGGDLLDRTARYSLGSGVCSPNRYFGHYDILATGASRPLSHVTA